MHSSAALTTVISRCQATIVSWKGAVGLLTVEVALRAEERQRSWAEVKRAGRIYPQGLPNGPVSVLTVVHSFRTDHWFKSWKEGCNWLISDFSLVMSLQLLECHSESWFPAGKSSKTFLCKWCIMTRSCVLVLPDMASLIFFFFYNYAVVHELQRDETVTYESWSESFIYVIGF